MNEAMSITFIFIVRSLLEILLVLKTMLKTYCLARKFQNDYKIGHNSKLGFSANVASTFWCSQTFDERYVSVV